MTTVIVEDYDAFKSAGAGEDNSLAAVSAIADYQMHIAGLRGDDRLIKWIQSGIFGDGAHVDRALPGYKPTEKRGPKKGVRSIFLRKRKKGSGPFSSGKEKDR